MRRPCDANVPLADVAHTAADNRALALASAEAQKTKKPLVVIYVISPQDYAAHDRGARRIDFMLRNLRIIKVRAQTSCLYLMYY